MKNAVLLTLFFLALFITTGCEDAVEIEPSIMVYTMDSTILPLVVYVDDSCVGIIRSIPELTERGEDGIMSPAYGSEGTVSVEVSEGMHTIIATADFLSGNDVPPAYRSNLTNSLTFIQIRWDFVVEAERGWMYPVCFGEYNR